MKSGTLLRQVINKINEINFNSASDRHLFGDIYDTTATAAEKNTFLNRYVMKGKFSSSVSSSWGRQVAVRSKEGAPPSSSALA